jgi:signal transduction histidine kinase
MILAILIVNGFLEISRSQKGFYLLLKREAVVLLQHYEKNIQGAFNSLQAAEAPPGNGALDPSVSGFLYSLEEAIGEYLVEAAFNVDQLEAENGLTPSDLQSLASQSLLTSIEIYNTEGKRLKGWPASPVPIRPEAILRELVEKKRSVVIDLFGRPLSGEGHRFLVAVRRKWAPGLIALRLSEDQMKRLFRQFAVERAISDLGLREDIVFVSVLDLSLNTIAHTETRSIGKRETDAFLETSLRAQQPVSRVYVSPEGDEIFEVVKPFMLGGKAAGLIRIGYSPREIPPVLRQIKKNVALSILFFLILGSSAITLIWVNQNRHLQRLKEMEDRIQLAERLSSLGHLAAGVAHEIRNPLNAIGLGIQRLKREFLPRDEAAKEEYLSFTQLISGEIRRVNGIVEQFLSLSRPFELDRKISPLGPLLRNVIALFQEQASTQGITIRSNMDGQGPLVNIDEQRLTQAVINIMKNGIEAMDHGGVLGIEAFQSKDRVSIRISDSGAGIPPEQMDKIFNFYYTTKENGVGLGLPIAHRIIEAHGGRLGVESQAGVGTTVTITLAVTR